MKGFGKWYEKGDMSDAVPGVKMTQTIFFKPSPDDLMPHDRFLRIAGVTLARYTACFQDTSRLKDSEAKLCMKHHPHREILTVYLSPPDSDNYHETSESDYTSSQPSSSQD